MFPDGELTGSGDIVTAVEDAGLEVQHQENLRVHYARTLAAWCANLVEHWDECVADAGLATAKVWGLYMAGSRLAFERNGIQLHQILATRTGNDGAPATRCGTTSASEPRPGDRRPHRSTAGAAGDRARRARGLRRPGRGRASTWAAPSGWSATET